MLFVTALISYTHRLILGVLVDPLRADLAVSDSAVSLLQGAAFTLIYVFASVPLGRLADRHVRRTLLIAGATLWCLATVLCGLAPTFWMLALGRVLVGIGEAALVPAAVSMIADAFPPERRGTAIGLFATGTVVGGPLGISIGGLLLAEADAGGFAVWPLLGELQPWRLVLVSVGLAGLVAPLLLATVREPRRSQLVRHERLSDAVRHLAGDWRLLAPIYAGLSLLSLGDYGLLSWAPTMLGRTFGWDPARIGVAFGVLTGAGALAGAALGGWCSDRAERGYGVPGRLAVCALGAFGAGTAAALIAVPRVEAVLASIGLWVFASTFGAIGGVAALQATVPLHMRATGAALFTFSNTLVGLGCGPTVIALVTDYVYGAPASVGLAIATTIVPAAGLSALLLLTARTIVRRRGLEEW